MTDAPNNPSARNTDPETSHVAAPDTKKKDSYRERILAAFRKRPKSGFTSEEVAIKAGLYKPGICYWKRVSELLELGLIEPLMSGGKKVTRISSMGRPQQVYILSAEA